MAINVDYLLEEVGIRDNILSRIDECADSGVGCCVGCSSDFVKIRRFEGMSLCDVCLGRVRESVECFGSVGDLSVDSVRDMISEAYVLFDMKKMQDVADKKYGGEIKKLLKTEYNVAPYEVKSDRLDFQTNDFVKIGKRRINKLIIDFDGEFLNDKTALRLGPDMDGTLAPKKVKGKVIQVPSIQTTNQTNTNNQVPSSSVPSNLSSKKIDNFEFYIGGDKIVCEFELDTPSNYQYKVRGIYGAKDATVTVPKSVNDNKIEDYLLDKVYGFIVPITNNRVSSGYVFGFYGESFKVILDKDSLKSKKTLFIIDWDNKSISKPSNKNLLEININKVSSGFEDNLKNLAEDRLKFCGVIPVGFSTKICGVSIDVDFQKFAVGKYLFKVSPKIGKEFDVIVDSKSLGKDKIQELIELRLDSVVSGFKEEFEFLISNPSTGKSEIFKAKLVKGSSVKSSKGNISFKVDCTTGLTLSKEYEVFDLSAIENILINSVKMDLNSVFNVGGNVVSDNKIKLFSKKADSSKEKLFISMGEHIGDLFLGKGSNRKYFVSVSDVKLSGRNIDSIVVTITDLVGNINNKSMRSYYGDFGKEVSINKVKNTVLDVGIDGLGMAFVDVSIEDEKFIKTLIDKFKLDEFFDIGLNKNLVRLVEGNLNRR
jgi:hypothetical protein